MYHQSSGCANISSFFNNQIVSEQRELSRQQRHIPAWVEDFRFQVNFQFDLRTRAYENETLMPPQG
jgi:hypothetical protein